ncbi:MAG: CNNM domain-containing protein [Thermodesulfobacteriota bacterium]|nr:CNNM domain-containing protein [Thermodesulfobacteriota bacterium]
MTELLIYLSVALLVSFLCSVLEAVVLSIPPSYIAIKNEEDSPLAKDLNRLRDNVDKPLAAILTLNTFAHTLGAAGVGAQAQMIWGKEYLSLISAVLTVLILILSEIIPKTIGANYWRELAPPALRLIRLLVLVLYPVVLMGQGITYVLKKQGQESIFSRSDLKMVAEAVHKEGSIGQNESDIIKNLMNFQQIKTGDIMTPRIVMRAEEEKTPVKDMVEVIDNIPFSRIPVYQEDIDHVNGFVLKDDLLREMADPDARKTLADLARPLYGVSSGLTVFDLFDYMVAQKAHILLVVDDYGGTEGLVTMEDVIETLLGVEIVDETDTTTDLQALARDHWEKRARKIGLLTNGNDRQSQEPPEST